MKKYRTFSTMLTTIAIICGFFNGSLNASTTKLYVVFESGRNKTLQIVNGERVVEISGGAVVDGPLQASPRVSLVADRASEAKKIADETGAVSWRQSAVGTHYVLNYRDLEGALCAAASLYERGLAASPVLLRKKHSRFTPLDPLFADQWHLRNTGQRRGASGIDLNLLPVWGGWRGTGVPIAIVDDGLQTRHPDLAPNCYSVISDPDASMNYDFNSEDTDPAPVRNDAHGTSVGGVAAARSNQIGGLGVAPEARLAGLRLTAAATDGETEARAFSWKNAVLSIYNNSWGPSDDGMTVEGPAPETATALQRGITFGRQGLGNIYVWSGGNGRANGDDANYDGYANSIFTIAIGALSDQARQTSESEPGACILAVTPSSSYLRQGIVTTDITGPRGYNIDGTNDGNVLPKQNYADLNYTNDFGMTSSAAPAASGVIALMLQANPNLRWRDVQEILIRTARRIQPTDADWKQNGAGFWFNHKFGAGLVDAAAAVNLARTWTNLPAPTQIQQSRSSLNLRIPDYSSQGASVEFDFSDTTRFAALRVEHVRFTVRVRHPYRGDLRFVLTSPSGKRSIVKARPDDDGADLLGWTFSSVHHWGENSEGVWRLTIVDTAESDEGRLIAATVNLRGTRR